MSSPTMWVPGRGISVSLRCNERPERDAVPEPQIDVVAAAEIGGEVVAQRQIAVEIRAEIAGIDAHGRSPVVHAQLQAVVVRQVDLGDPLEKGRMALLQELHERHAELHPCPGAPGVPVVDPDEDRIRVILRLAAVRVDRDALVVHQPDAVAQERQPLRHALFDGAEHAVRQHALHDRPLHPAERLEVAPQADRVEPEQVTSHVAGQRPAQIGLWRVARVRELDAPQPEVPRVRQVMPRGVRRSAEHEGRAGGRQEHQPAPAPSLAKCAAPMAPQDAQGLGVAPRTRGVDRSEGGTRAAHVQTITSVASASPVLLPTSSRTLSINAATSAKVAPPRLTMKLACTSEMTAWPTASPLRPLWSMSRPACPPGGFLKMQPAFLAPVGWVATRWS